MVTNQEVAETMKKVQTVINELYDLYSKDETLNDRQPKSMSKVLPMSIGDWLATISQNIQDWEDGENGN